MIKTTIQNTIKELQLIGNSTPVNIVYVTEPDHTKRDNPFYNQSSKKWKIEKVGIMNGLCGVSYQNSVNNEREREDSTTDFVSAPIWGGKGRHVDRYLVEHVQHHKQYLKVKQQGTVKVQYRFIDTKQTLSNEELLILAMFESQKSHDSSRQQVEKPVYWNLIEVHNLLQLSFNHQTYVMGE